MLKEKYLLFNGGLTSVIFPVTSSAAKLAKMQQAKHFKHFKESYFRWIFGWSGRIFLKRHSGELEKGMPVAIFNRQNQNITQERNWSIHTEISSGEVKVEANWPHPFLAFGKMLKPNYLRGYSLIFDPIFFLCPPRPILFLSLCMCVCRHKHTHHTYRVGFVSLSFFFFAGIGVKIAFNLTVDILIPVWYK